MPDGPLSSLTYGSRNTRRTINTSPAVLAANSLEFVASREVAGSLTLPLRAAAIRTGVAVRGLFRVWLSSWRADGGCARERYPVRRVEVEGSSGSRRVGELG